MKVVAIIQARMGSTRLHGKVLKPVLGKSLLAYQLERVQQSKFIDQVVVATTEKQLDRSIIDLCDKLSIASYRGSEVDVLSRYVGAADQYEADVVVRMTADCPVIDPSIIDEVIQHYLNGFHFDYVSNTSERTFPRGMDVEVFSTNVLHHIDQEAEGTQYREHVTPYIYKNPQRYKLGVVRNDVDLSHYRLTVDTPADFQLIKTIIEHLYVKNTDFSLKKIVEFLQRNPALVKLNAHIEQKQLHF